MAKQAEQLGEKVLQEWDYVFSENGLMAYKGGQLIAQQSLKSHLGEEKIKKFINFTLHYLADLDIPIKRYGSSFVTLITSHYVTPYHELGRAYGMPCSLHSFYHHSSFIAFAAAPSSSSATAC